ncbi:MAG TPA: nuclear transport factor 2 family protein [Mycobacteriales bacterium]|nr:nuclear transport factor 2 family protein [Mycobacteriales bacterium]
MDSSDVQAISDRLAIQDLISRYPVLVDNRDLDALDALFTADAHLDFTSFGGPNGGLAEVKEFLTVSLGMFASTQHMMGLPAIALNAHTATAKTSCHNPMVMAGPDGKRQAWLIGLWYDDEFVKTADGWRIASRTATRCYAVLNLHDTSLTA